MSQQLPTPHLEKLLALQHNEKLPIKDQPRIQSAIVKYQDWISKISAPNLLHKDVNSIITTMTGLLNEYRNYIDLNLIFDSEEDFLYRQKGQLKLDNSVIEEFLPYLITSINPEISKQSLKLGPTASFSSLHFASSLDTPKVAGGLSIKTKNQDFTISKPLFLKASHSKEFEPNETLEMSTFITYIAAECKTNLDKTMFQEASATAHDIKTAVAGAKYYLLCEWLDMTPLSTASTDIDEIIILRKAKRINSNIRRDFNSSTNRKKSRNSYEAYIINNPLRPEMFQRFAQHIHQLLMNETPNEKNILDLGYF